MKTVSFIPDPENKGSYRVKQYNNHLCSLPYIGKVVTIDDHSIGCRMSAHPNIGQSGSVAGMKNMGYWRKNDVTVRQRNFIYNVSSVACTSIIDELCLAIEQDRAHRTNLKNGRIRYTFN